MLQNFLSMHNKSSLTQQLKQHTFTIAPFPQVDSSLADSSAQGLTRCSPAGLGSSSRLTGIQSIVFGGLRSSAPRVPATWSTPQYGGFLIQGQQDSILGLLQISVTSSTSDFRDSFKRAHLLCEPHPPVKKVYFGRHAFPGMGNWGLLLEVCLMQMTSEKFQNITGSLLSY